MVKYYYVKEKLHNPKVGDYTAYAVSAYKHLNHKKIRVAYISDVFLDESDAKKFIQLCNKLELAPVHLPQVIEEALINNQ